MTTSRKNLSLRTLSGLLLAITATTLLATWTTTTAQKQTALTGPSFFIRNYAGKCLDFGAPPTVTGSPVFIFDCNGTIAQQVRIQEINEHHNVILRAGTKVIGVNMDPVLDTGESERRPGATALEVEIPLELQDQKDPNTVFSRGQIFVLDGDSIILAANRKLVVKVKNARGADRTPLVLGQRNLADAEFWDFNATDGSRLRPTTGFVSVTTPDAEKFVNDLQAATPGTVFELDPDLSLDLTNRYVTIPSGVTIRGDRRGTRYGPEIFTTRAPENVMFDIVNSIDVRITGLRLRGPSRTTDSDVTEAYGIRTNQQSPSTNRSIIDHNNMSAWTLAAVDVRGTDLADYCQAGDDNAGNPEEHARVVRNFFHHNQKQGEGYGVHTANGGRSLIEGNTFDSNRHAIAAEGDARTIYRAWYNLVLTSAPTQVRGLIFRWHTHDFDMHGTGDSWNYPSGFGGIGGQYVQIERNTFLGTNRNNFKLRGEPCYRAEFLHNVSMLPRWEAVECTRCGDEDKLISNNSLNWYESKNPTDKLGTGDFDGDGTEDLFLATGAAWYYSPRGAAEWRFLNAQTDGIDFIRFGDFDGDRRTDVLSLRGRDLVVSWGGVSQWERINGVNSSLSFKEYRTGDFIGDKRADIFYADGQQWWLSDGGSAPFTQAATSGYQTDMLGFGDFNADGKTDVLGVESGMWKVSLNATGAWSGFELRSALTTSSIGKLIIADLNANGRADVISSNGKKVSYDGRGNWDNLPSRPGTFSTVGYFDDNPGADILFFWENRHYLGIKSSGVGSSQRHSSQNMR